MIGRTHLGSVNHDGGTVKIRGRDIMHSARPRVNGHGKPGPILLRREMIAFLPACALALLWVGVEGFVILALTATLVGWATRPLSIPEEERDLPCDPVSGLPLHDEALDIWADFLVEARERGRPTACLVIGLDAPDQLRRALYHREYAALLRAMHDRIALNLRIGDRVTRWEDARFLVLLKPTPRLDLEGVIQLAGRVQESLADPFLIEGRAISASAHIGFRLIGRDLLNSPSALIPETLLSQARQAADFARRSGPGSLRAFSGAMRQKKTPPNPLAGELSDAIEEGQIKVFFAPRISTDTGEIAGLEAVPRWLHRSRGILTETEIVAASEATGLAERVCEIIFFETLVALRDFARSGDEFGRVSLSLTLRQLRDPKLAERITWDCDRFDVTPERMGVIVAQDTVDCLGEGAVAHNLHRLHAAGASLELAGFSAGPGPDEAIRKLSPRCLRIGAPLVAKLDHDPEAQRLVSAIVGMAETIGLGTLAEGVSGLTEHAMLAQLGCTEVQGPAIAAPMPSAALRDWAAQHRRKLAATPQLDLGGTG